MFPRFPMRSLILAALLALLPFHAFAFCDDWTRENTVLEASFQGLTLIDWGQTLNVVSNPNLAEANPILGPHPSRERINTLIPLGMAAHAALSCLLPAGPWREAWQVISAALEFSAVGNNATLGVSIRFPF